MAALPPVPPQALHEAMARFDTELRHLPDWQGWDLRQSQRYAIEHNGQRYPPKQIVSMATGVPVSEFSGGQARTNAYVTARGLSIVELRPARNPTWIRDELILALDLYLQHAGNPPGHQSAEILELSTTLDRLGRYLALTKSDRFRNPNGVYMKLMNFRRFDPAFAAVGKAGLSRGGKLEEDIWNEFAADPARCHAVAETIRGALEAVPEGDVIAVPPVGDEEEEAEEGRVITAMHRSYERDQKIVQRKKQQVLAALGRLACEACGFDFEQRYGKHGAGYIECHHTKPVHTLKPGEKTKIRDLRLLCSNCHSMVHARRPWLDMRDLAVLLEVGQNAG